MRRKLLLLFLPILLLCFLSSCQEYKYRIGVSQCGKDDWHAKMVGDLMREANSHPEVEVLFRVADHETQEQLADLEDLYRQNIDLLIVSPNHADELEPIISKFYDRGTPVIVVDRTLHGNKYTASVSSDNQDIGKRLGTYIASKLGGHGRILEITGTATTSTSQERHRGLAAELAKFPDIQIVVSEPARWSKERARHLTDSLLRAYPDIDLIAAHNDLMAEGAYEACQELHRDSMPIIGVDCLPNQGLNDILNGRLSATCANPSGAVEAFDVALNILEGKPYEKKTVLSTLLVDEHNAPLVLMHSQMLQEYDKKIEDINGELGFYWRRARLQHMLLVACALILSLIVAMILIITRSRHIQERLRIKNLLLKLYHIETVTKEKDSEESNEPAELNLPDAEFNTVDTTFVTRLQDYIMANMSNPDLNVNDLCNEMNMSRVQLYRKCKTQTNFSPVEFVRIIRLKHANDLLQNTHHSISEIAYEVGFSSPSYFAKCYRDQYGISPTESKK